MSHSGYTCVEPSILAGDFGALAEEARRIEKAGADGIHIDIMDGHFVPNLSFGPKALAAINRATDLYLDVHIMVYNPFSYIEELVASGADCITFHIEATEDVEETLSYIRTCNRHAGLAFCPQTSVSLIPNYLDKCDRILLMTVEPGFGGQPFIEGSLERIRFVRTLCQKMNLRKGGVIPKDDQAKENALPPFDIQVDGGVDKKWAAECIKAGANSIVSGTYLFEGKGMAEKIAEMRR